MSKPRKNKYTWIMGGACGSLLIVGIIIQFTHWQTWFALPVFFVIFAIYLVVYFNA